MSRAKKSGSNNLLGCLTGCLVIFVVLVLLVAGVAFYSVKYGSLSASPKSDTTALVSPGATLTLRVDLEAPTAISLAQIEGDATGQTGALVRMFRPYEGSVALSVSPDGKEVYASAAVSSPRGAGFLVNMLEAMRPDLEQNGRTLTQLQVDPEHPGVLAMRMVLPSPAEAPGLRGEAWTTPAPGAPPTSAANHFVELALDNRNGDAGLAITALAQSMGEESPELGAVGADATTDVALSLLSQVRIIKGSRLLSTLHATVDFTPEGNMDVVVALDATNEVSAMMLMSSLGILPERLAQDWEETGIKVTGSFERTGSQIAGTLHFAGAIDQLRLMMKTYNERGGIAGFTEGEVPFPGLETLKP